jgi:two-component system, cell cycle sensor histidine kinase and response regulator CckA
MAQILIVEDEHIVALDIKRHLEKFGYSVCGMYSTGEETLRDVGSLMPDLILMDIKLQGKLDGVEVAREINENYRIPVILLTAYADEETVARAKITQPFGYIIKPFEERELRTTIEIALYRHSMEEKVRESEERYRTVFEDDLSGNFIAGADGAIVACNSSFIRLFEYPDKDAALARPFRDFFPAVSVWTEFIERVSAESHLELYELSLLTSTGKTVSVLANIVGDFDDSGTLVSVKGFLIDNTERKTLEIQLRQSQKLEAIGRLSGGVAHDFNNIITAIIGYTNLLKEELGDNESAREDVEGIQKSAQKAANLTRQLLAFARQQTIKPRIADINALVQDMDKMIRRLVTEDINVAMYLYARMPLMKVDVGQFEQVVINLVVNARDAMSSGGQLVVETRNETVKADQPGFPDEVRAGNYVVFSVRDTGTGIKPEVLTKIFEPFFTTKEKGEGTGLGLPTVLGIVHGSGGAIRVQTEPGRGSSFIIYIPLSNEQPSIVEPTVEPAQECRGTETLLLVEDEDMLRSIVSRMLNRAGYHVIEARNSGEALIISETMPEKIDLLVTDVILPHMNGYRLAERLGLARPGLKSMFMSGYPENKDEAGSRNFLQKPFNQNQLLELVRKTLDREAEIPSR